MELDQHIGGGSGGTSFIRSTDFVLRTVDAGVGVQLTGRRVMFEPWVGLHFARGHRETFYTEMDPNKPPAPPNEEAVLRPSPLVTWGLVFAVDVWRGQPDRFSLFVAAQSCLERPGPELTTDYTVLTLGAAYRR